MFTAIKLLAFVLAVFQIALLLLAVYVVFQVVEDPASLGHFAGAVVKGFKEAF